MLNFGNVNIEIPLPNSCCPGMKYAWSAQSEKKKKKKFCDNCGNAIAENGRKKINKLWLPKSGEELKKKCYVHNIFTTFLQQIIGD